MAKARLLCVPEGAERETKRSGETCDERERVWRRVWYVPYDTTVEYAV